MYKVQGARCRYNNVVGAASVGHRKTAISELDVLLNAIKETSVLHTGETVCRCIIAHCTALSLAISAIAGCARGTLAIKTQLD